MRRAKILTAIYNFLICFYPHSHRMDFGEEMRSDFWEGLVDADALGFTRMAAFCWRELREWPAAVLLEHWGGFFRRMNELSSKLVERRIHFDFWLQQRSYLMFKSDAQEDILEKNPRLMLIASLPPLLFGLGLTVTNLISMRIEVDLGNPIFILGLGATLLPAVFIGIVALYALTKRIPPWSLSWVGFGFMGFALFLNMLGEEQAEVGKYLLSEVGDLLLLILLMLIGLGFLIAIGSRGWRQAGLFSLGLAGMLGITVFTSIVAGPFLRHDIAQYAVVVGLLMSTLIYVYMRGTDPVRFGVIAGAGCLNLTLAGIANSVWNASPFMEGKPSPILPMLVFLTAMLISGPVMAVLIRPIKKNLRRA